MKNRLEAAKMVLQKDTENTMKKLLHILLLFIHNNLTNTFNRKQNSIEITTKLNNCKNRAGIQQRWLKIFAIQRKKLIFTRKQLILNDKI